MVLPWKNNMEKYDLLKPNQLSLRMYKVVKQTTKSNSIDLKYIFITIAMNGNTNRVYLVPFDMVTKSVTHITFQNWSNFPQKASSHGNAFCQGIEPYRLVHEKITGLGHTHEHKV